MSDMSRLLLTYDTDTPGVPESIIAKFPPTDADSHSTGLELGFFEGESGFYRELADRTEIRTPRCYYSQFDANTGQFLILLEDLSAARLGDVTVRLHGYRGRFGCGDSGAPPRVLVEQRFVS